MPTQTSLTFPLDLEPFRRLPQVLVIGRRARLADAGLAEALGLSHPHLVALLSEAESGDEGATVETRSGERRVILGVLPEPCSRHNSPSRAWAIPAMVEKLGARTDAGVLLVVEQDEQALASALAAARSLPLYDRKTGPARGRTVSLTALGPAGPVQDTRLPVAVEALRQASRLVDMPTRELHTQAFVDEALALGASIGASVRVIQGELLQAEGLGGLQAVGGAAVHGPALVLLEHAPAGATKTIALVGKGIVYDTGGLSLKGKDSMPGMKGDMGGAAAVLHAFGALVRAGYGERLQAVLCLAENAVGPEAYRPDDIITCASGKTVEVNNTDAEGRIVLADGVAWICRQGLPDVLIDMATLTGAALVATGKVHAGIYSNDEALELAAIAAGKRVGEPVHPFLYAPELHRKEFKSKVADMKNSVKDRNNAQSSCAAQFIANHLPDPAPRWLHIDIAGPALGERGTGYGVGLLVELVPRL